jgi:hypothetical protein
MSNLFNDKSRYPDLLFFLAACLLYVPSQGIAIPRIPTVLAVMYRLPGCSISLNRYGVEK